MTGGVTLDFSLGDPDQLERNAAMCLALGQTHIDVKLTPAVLRQQARVLRAAQVLATERAKTDRMAHGLLVMAYDAQVRRDRFEAGFRRVALWILSACLALVLTDLWRTVLGMG